MSDVPNFIVYSETDKTRRRRYTSYCLFALVVLTALVTMFYVLVNKTPADKANAEAIALDGQVRLCVGKYQDAVDGAADDRAQAIGELIVIITQIPPGDDRELAVTATVKALDASNLASKTAIDAKAAYNKAGRTLPCPLE